MQARWTQRFVTGLLRDLAPMIEQSMQIREKDADLVPRYIPQSGPKKQWRMVTEGQRLLALKYVRLVIKRVLRIQTRRQSANFQELVGVGMIALGTAAATWNPERTPHVKFITHAQRVIDRELWQEGVKACEISRNRSGGLSLSRVVLGGGIDRAESREGVEDMEAGLDRKMQLDVIRTAMDQVVEECRERCPAVQRNVRIFARVMMMGHSVREVAEEMGITVQLIRYSVEWVRDKVQKKVQQTRQGVLKRCQEKSTRRARLQNC